MVRRLRTGGLLCGGDDGSAKELRQCAEDSLPEVGTLLAFEPWLPAEWFRGGSSVQRNFRRHVATTVGRRRAWLDATLQPVLDELKEKGELESTVTIFTADHGAFFAGKGHPYEAGIRVPLLLRWRAASATRRATSTSASRTSTCCRPSPSWRASRSTAPASPAAALRGCCEAPQPAAAEAPLFVEVGFSRTVVVDGWKLILVLPPPELATAAGGARELPRPAAAAAQREQRLHRRSAAPREFVYDGLDRHGAHYCEPVQLYDTARDPAEQTNVAEHHPERVATLRAMIERHIAETEGSKAQHPKAPAAPKAAAAPKPAAAPKAAAPKAAAAGAGAAAWPRPETWCSSCYPRRGARRGRPRVAARARAVGGGRAPRRPSRRLLADAKPAISRRRRCASRRGRRASAAAACCCARRAAGCSSTSWAPGV